MKKKKLIKALNITFTLILLILSYWGVSATIEHIKFNEEINAFKESSVFESEERLYGYKTRFYVVQRQDWMRQKPVYVRGKSYIGTDGDMFLTRVSPLGVPVVDEIIFNMFGGHSAIITDNGLKQIEAQGDAADGSNHVKKIGNDWLNYSGETVGIRVKGASEEDYQRALAVGEELVAKKAPYNYSFIFNTKKSFYCTDLLTYMFRKVDININDDYFASTTYDLIVSKNTYITYFSYVDKDNIRHLYYTN